MKAMSKEIQVLEGFFDKDTPKINLKVLADFFGKPQADIANALQLDPTAVSRNPLATPDGKIKAWLAIFNLIIEVVSQAEPELTDSHLSDLPNPQPKAQVEPMLTQNQFETLQFDLKT